MCFSNEPMVIFKGAVKRGAPKLLTLSIVTMLFICLSCPAIARSQYVRNGGCERKGAAKTFSQEKVEKLRQDGWTCPDAKDWPTWWTGGGRNMKLEYIARGGKENDPFIKISGKDGYITAYLGTPLEGNKIYRFWVRGKGTLRAGYLAWKIGEDGKLAGMIQLRPIIVKVNSKKWVRYRHSLIKPDFDVTLHPSFKVLEGTVDLDEVDIEPSDGALDLIVAEEEKLYGTGALIENLTLVQADDIFKAKAAQFAAAVKEFEAKANSLDKDLAEAMKRRIETLKAYVLPKGITAVQSTHYNEMIAMTRVLKRLAGAAVGAAEALWAKEAAPVDVSRQLPGVRRPRPGKITITDIRSNKTRYDENETARTTATVVNKTGARVSGTLIARMILDLDTVREITRAGFTVEAGREKKWSFSYNVGPETYGRAIEVEFIDAGGSTLDKWQEYYAVAAEYFRVQQHSYGPQNKLYKVNVWTTYHNQRHYFANEPTDACVQGFDAEVIISGQAGYRVNQERRQAEINHYKRFGVMSTFYQTRAFCGQMGYEVMRRHPEFVLYDGNGQFGVDPIYGGHPNPMELASPLEVGPLS